MANCDCRIRRIEEAQETWEKYFKTSILVLQNKEQCHYAAFILATMCVEHAYRAIMGKDIEENCIKDALKWVMQMYFDSIGITDDSRQAYAVSLLEEVASELIRANVFNPLKHQGQPQFKADFPLDDGKALEIKNERDASGFVTVELINDPGLNWIFNRTVDTEITGYVEDANGEKWATRDVKQDSQKVLYNARWWIDAFQNGIDYGYRRTIENCDCTDSESTAPHPPAPEPPGPPPHGGGIPQGGKGRIRNDTAGALSPSLFMGEGFGVGAGSAHP